MKTSEVSVLLNVWWIYPCDTPLGDLCDLGRAGMCCGRSSEKAGQPALASAGNVMDNLKSL